MYSLFCLFLFTNKTGTTKKQTEILRVDSSVESVINYNSSLRHTKLLKGIW
ncbi:hypothetical protein M2105_006637 [Paenibacillus sp. PastF-1]|nr:hypothetical protein [Paenibacillus sp. PastF-2]MDF9852137.1 hypothetical protein [Paenibacillus sp. PastM-2]MDF9858709.1 hypothetical protein [Paenibacillus sp. PastF-1]MDH6483974.1 hypothetical protein [Paenibacillus sp. PastH-2]MDH6511348.1 hypothetical protein [Paenibacillus sp. PastM-3]